MDIPIQHYKENGADDQYQHQLLLQQQQQQQQLLHQQSMQQPHVQRSEWEPCLPGHQSQQNMMIDSDMGERPPPPPPPSKRRFRSPAVRKPDSSDDRSGKMRETIVDRQVSTQHS